MAIFSALTFLVLIGLMSIAAVAFISTLLNRFGHWAKSYQQLAKRYGTKVVFSLGKPKLTFNYGNALCVLSNTKTRFRSDRRTQLRIQWDDRKLKLFVSSLGAPTGRKSWTLKPIDIDNQLSEDRFVIYSNQAEMAERMLTSAARWQVRQLIHHHGNSGVEVFIRRGQMLVSKPGYIRDHQPLDDFARFALDLFDQFKLAYNQDIEFVSDDTAVVVADVKCPICSEQIAEEMVVCVRCKTPHCVDCWEYNGGCATYACSETRCFPNLPGQSARMRGVS